ncbi:MAG: hypothetical protein HC837_03585, partial [Chloroflexaceae bacterium]|nr:hypothetical protein [Chloroflexaceae bacterium]
MNEPAYPFQLLTTKWSIPPVRPDLLPRPQLVAWLQDGLAKHTLILIAAPAGSGKTSLLSAWQAEVGDSLPMAWFWLDSGDNDLARWLTYVTAALETIVPGVSQATLPFLQSASTISTEMVLTALINQLAAHAGQLVLVLEDYHIITNPAIHQALTFLLDHVPPQVHLIVTSRSTPPIARGRLQGRGKMLELGPNQLRFSVAETADFLNTIMGLALSEEDIQTLFERTEGWPVGLYLAALMMQGRRDRQSFIRSFSGGHRSVMRYMLEEVLLHQSESVQAFLLYTAPLDWLTVPLCEAVLRGLPGASDDHEPVLLPQVAVRSMLDYLEQQNLFLLPWDDQARCYRYDHLFGAALRQRLQQLEPQTAALIHRRASRWYEQEARELASSYVVESVRHALEAGDSERAAALMQPNALQMVQLGKHETLLGWIERLPQAVLQQRPWLSYVAAWANVLAGQWEAHEPLLNLAEATWQASQDIAHLGELYHMRAHMQRLRGDAAGTIAAAQQALEWLPPTMMAVRASATAALGAGYLLQGNLSDAELRLADAYQQSKNVNPFAFLCTLNAMSDLAALQGQLQRAAGLAHEVLKRDDVAGQHVYAHIQLAELSYEWHHLSQAEEHLEQATSLTRQLRYQVYVARGHLAWARLYAGRGEDEAAQTELEQAIQVARRIGNEPLHIQAQALQVRLWLAQGNMQAAAAWASILRRS